MLNEKEVRRDCLKISIKFKNRNKRSTRFTVYGKGIGIYSYNAIMNEDSDCCQFIYVHDAGINHIVLKATEDNKQCTLLITSPYHLVGFIINDQNLIIDFNGLHFCSNLRYLSIKNTDSIVSFYDLAGCDSLRRLEVDNTNCASDIYLLSGFKDLMWVSMDNTKCTGNISHISKLKKLWRFSATNASVYGDLSKINCPEIEKIKLDGTLCTGDFNKFINDNHNLSELKIGQYNYRRDSE